MGWGRWEQVLTGALYLPQEPSLLYSTSLQLREPERSRRRELFTLLSFPAAR